MVVMAIFALVTIGLIYAQVFGLRMYTIIQCKLSSTEDARAAVNKIRAEVLTASSVTVGTGDENSFTGIGLNQPQIGNALQVCPTTNRAWFIRYYFDPSDSSLKRIVNGLDGVKTVAQAVTNQLGFQAEDCYGNVLTNDRNNRVIQMTLEFYQLQYPTVRIGPGYLYDYYRLQTKMTRRTIQ